MRLDTMTLIVAVGASAACHSNAKVQCEVDPNCNLIPSGVCATAETGNRWCAYPDPECTSGYRYANEDVGDGVSGDCVAAVADAGVDAPALDALPPIDASVIDGDTSCRLRVAFVDGEPPVFVGSIPGHREVWIANPDGSAMLNLSNDSNADDIDPSWSPNGLRLAFASNRSGHFDIFSVNVDGTGLANLTSGSDHPFDATSPRWSPDGTRIAFVHNDAAWAMNANGTGAAQVSTRRVSTLYAWSPDNTKLIFSSFSPNVPSLYLATIGDGSPTTKLSAGTAFEANAHWAPHARIAFDNGRNVYTVNGDGTDLVDVTQDLSSNSLGSVTDDGGVIVFSSTRNNGNTELWTSSTVSGAPTKISANTLAFGGDFAKDISPDGRLVVYTRKIVTVVGSVSTTTNELGIVGIDGTGNRTFNAPNQHHATTGTFSSCQ